MFEIEDSYLKITASKYLLFDADGDLIITKKSCLLTEEEAIKEAEDFAEQYQSLLPLVLVRIKPEKLINYDIEAIQIKKEVLIMNHKEPTHFIILDGSGDIRPNNLNTCVKDSFDKAMELVSAQVRDGNRREPLTIYGLVPLTEVRAKKPELTITDLTMPPVSTVTKTEENITATEISSRLEGQVYPYQENNQVGFNSDHSEDVQECKFY